MKKFLFALLAVSLIALAVIPTACKKVETPSNYSNYSLEGVTLSYPSDWSDKTAEVEKEMDADYKDYSGFVIWNSPADVASLMVMVFDLDAMGAHGNLSDADKEDAATGFSGMIATLMDNPVIVSDGKTSVDGEWAWETEFNGKVEGMSAKGYGLIVFHDRDLVMTLYAGEAEHWGEVGGVYNAVKESIKFQ